MLRVAAEKLLQRVWFPSANPRLPSWLARTGLSLLLLLLLPLSWLTRYVTSQRRARLLAHRHSDRLGQRAGAQPENQPARDQVTVVVGNLVVGGAGKTPATIALARALAARGWKVGLLGHGYRAGSSAAMLIDPKSDATTVGDEAVLLALETSDRQLPVAAGRDRHAALQLLLEKHPSLNVVICDDGLQHAGLRRDIELVVFDSRGIGNGRLLPAGPLREPVSHAVAMDAVLLNGGASLPLPHRQAVRFVIEPGAVVPLADFLAGRAEAGTAGEQAETLRRAIPAARVRAFAGMADPLRFQRTLTELGWDCPVQALGDHGRLPLEQLARTDADLILVTAKDAVKLRAVSDPRIYVVRVAARFPGEFIDWLEQRIKEHGSKEHRSTRPHLGERI